MKETILDVLIYLFENYMDDTESAAETDQETLKHALREAGFPNLEINKAFDWLESLAEQQDNFQAEPLCQLAAPIRVYCPEEILRLDIHCRGFLMFLEQTGVLDPSSRELVIDRVMALETEEVSLEQVKWVILMVLFNQPGQESVFSWMEELVYDEIIGQRH